MELIQGKGYYCSNCGHCVEEGNLDDIGPLYECGDCGTRFTRNTSYDGVSHRCPDCGKYAGKVCTYACSECEEGETEWVDVWGLKGGEAWYTTEKEARDNLDTSTP